MQFYDTTYNDTTLSGDADFYDSSYNAVTGIVPGSANFNDTTYNAGTVNGNVQLNDSSYNASAGNIVGTAYIECDAYNDVGGTIGGAITYQACTQYTASSTDWDDVAAWWLDAGMTNAAHRVPSSIDDVFINDSITTNSGAPAVVNNLTVNNASDVGIDITVVGSATFNNTSTNSATIT